LKHKDIITMVSLHRWVATTGVNLSNRNIQMLISGYQRDDGIDVAKLVSDLQQSQTFKQTWSP
jgi:hypothetical protein